MKAIAIFPDKKEIRLIEVEEPNLKNEDDVKIKMVDVGVCGTDLNICAFKHPTVLPGEEDHLIIGHEAMGQVMEVGSGVTGFNSGDYVVPLARRNCGQPECAACAANRPDFCLTGKFEERGVHGLHGYMAEVVVEDADHLNVVPADLKEVGVLTEPLSIAEKALYEVWHIQTRLPWAARHRQHPDRKELDLSPQEKGYTHTALVTGAGTIGLLAAMLLKFNGFKTYVYSKSSETESQKVCEELGVTYLDEDKIKPETLEEEIGQIDLIFEATGASEMTYQLMSQLGQNGVFILVGIPAEKNKFKITADELIQNQIRKNQVVFGTVNGGKVDQKRAIQSLADFKKLWPNALAHLITHRYSPEEALKPLKDDTGERIKNLISFV